MENALQLPKALGDILGLAVFALLLALTRSLYAKFTPNITKTLLAGMIGAAICYFVIGISGNVILSFLACILVGIFSAMLWPGTLILMEEKVPNPGVAAFALGTACGVLFGKLMYIVTGGKINPLIGSAGVSAVPMEARVSQMVGQKENPSNFLLMHAMGPNVAGVIGSAVAAGVLLSIIPH